MLFIIIDYLFICIYSFIVTIWWCVCSVLSVAYSIAKYGMSLCVLGMSEELKADGIAVNALWPKTGN